MLFIFEIGLNSFNYVDPEQVILLSLHPSKLKR